jgi:hypothetical protein
VYVEERDGFTLQWQKCCCGVKVYGSIKHEPPADGHRPTVPMHLLGEFPMVDDTFEKTAERYGPAAVIAAKEKLA